MARRGRPRKTGRRVKGRLIQKTRFETQAQITEAAMAKRLQMGLPARLARSTGSPEGVLFALYDETCDPETGIGDKRVGIDRDQHDAAVFYQTCRLEYLGAIQDSNAPQQPRTKTGSGDLEAHEQFCRMATERWNDMRTMLQERQIALGNTSNLFAALDGLVNEAPQTYQLGDLREALNVIHSYRTSRKKRAA